MPTVAELIREKIRRLQSVPDSLVTKVDKANEQIWEELLILLDELERDSAGNIILSQENLVISEQISQRLRKVVFDTDYQEAITAYAGEFDKQAEITFDYFDKVFKGLTDQEVFNTILRQSQINALELLTEDAVASNFINPLKDLLNGAITGNGKFTDAIKTLRDYTLTNDLGDGELTRYVKTIAYTSFSVSDAQYTKTISEFLNAQWFKWAGGELPDSRPFCVEYHNQFFSKQEIDNFGNEIDIDGSHLSEEMLQGRIAGTNAATIWSFKGGWNCKHSILPVSEFSVPPSVIERNKLKGYV